MEVGRDGAGEKCGVDEEKRKQEVERWERNEKSGKEENDENREMERNRKGGREMWYPGQERYRCGGGRKDRKEKYMRGIRQGRKDRMEEER